MRLVIFGASGPTGRRATRAALEQGAHVTAVTRRPDDFPLAHPQLRVVGADVKDAEAVRGAIEGHDAVICTVGVHYTRHDIDTYSAAAANIVDAMRHEGVDRLVCVTSMGADGRQASPDDPWVMRRLVVPVLHRLGRTNYADMKRMEQILFDADDIDWLVLRPAGLFDTDEVNDHEVSRTPLRGMFTSRADLAHVLVEQATRPSHHRVALDVVTRSNTPRYRDLFLREALGIGKEKTQS